MPRARLGPDDIVLSAGTLPRATFRERAAAARAGGFAGVGLRIPDLARARADGLSDADLRAILADAGLVATDVEAITDFGPCLRGGAGTAREPTALERRACDVALAVGATTVTVVEGGGAAMPIAPAADAFGLLCDRAAAAGLDVAIEPWPGSSIDVARAAAIVETAAQPNGGLVVDTWHCHHDAQAHAVLRALPGARVKAVQIADVGDEAAVDYLAATMHRRRLPGEGGSDLAAWVRALDRIGSSAPFGVEVLSDALNALPPLEIGRRAGRAMRALLVATRAA